MDSDWIMSGLAAVFIVGFILGVLLLPFMLYVFYGIMCLVVIGGLAMIIHAVVFGNKDH